MKSSLALIAMAAAATANASVSDAVLANAMASVSAVATAVNGRRHLDQHEKEDEKSYVKVKCAKGQATVIAAFKADGIDLVVPTAGYCLDNTDNGESMLLTCDGTKLNAQMDDKAACKQVTATTTKVDASDFLGKCVVGEVGAVQVTNYKKADCSDSANVTSFVFGKDSCLEGTKMVCESDKITVSKYTGGEDSKCTGDAIATLDWTSGDDKCHDTEAAPAPLKKECPEGSENGAESEAMFDKACCMSCKEDTSFATCADVQKVISKGGCYDECFGAMKKGSKQEWLKSIKTKENKPVCSEAEAKAAEEAAEEAAAPSPSDSSDSSDSNTATVGFASVAILAVVAALGF